MIKASNQTRSLHDHYTLLTAVTHLNVISSIDCQSKHSTSEWTESCDRLEMEFHGGLLLTNGRLTEATEKNWAIDRKNKPLIDLISMIISLLTLQRC